MEEIPVPILERFDELYRALKRERILVAVPSREEMLKLVQRCSFKMFEDTEEYVNCERAQNFPHLISPTFGNRAFRVYFNSHSQKVYVDLNRETIGAIRLTEETEAKALCEILRSILFVDPSLESSNEPTVV